DGLRDFLIGSAAQGCQPIGHARLPPSRSCRNVNRMGSSPWVFDTTEQHFARDVVARSLETPVVVDVWAPWSAPCRVLAPVLERLVDELGGAVLLAKLNADENPVASRELGVQGIPAVRAFRDGARVAEFVGAQPERFVRRFLQAILPTEADRLARE